MPGAIALTLIGTDAHSIAQLLAKAATPALDALYTGIPPEPSNPGTAESLNCHSYVVTITRLPLIEENKAIQLGMILSAKLASILQLHARVEDD